MLLPGTGCWPWAWSTCAGGLLKVRLTFVALYIRDSRVGFSWSSEEGEGRACWPGQVDIWGNVLWIAIHSSFLRPSPGAHLSGRLWQEERTFGPGSYLPSDTWQVVRKHFQRRGGGHQNKPKHKQKTNQNKNQPIYKPKRPPTKRLLKHHIGSWRQHPLRKYRGQKSVWSQRPEFTSSLWYWLVW